MIEQSLNIEEIKNQIVQDEIVKKNFIAKATKFAQIVRQQKQTDVNKKKALVEALLNESETDINYSAQSEKYLNRINKKNLTKNSDGIWFTENYIYNQEWQTSICRKSDTEIYNHYANKYYLCDYAVNEAHNFSSEWSHYLFLKLFIFLFPTHDEYLKTNTKNFIKDMEKKALIYVTIPCFVLLLLVIGALFLLSQTTAITDEKITDNIGLFIFITPVLYVYYVIYMSLLSMMLLNIFHLCVLNYKHLVYQLIKFCVLNFSAFVITLFMYIISPSTILLIAILLFLHLSSGAIIAVYFCLVESADSGDLYLLAYHYRPNQFKKYIKLFEDVMMC